MFTVINARLTNDYGMVYTNINKKELESFVIGNINSTKFQNLPSQLSGFVGRANRLSSL